MYHKEKRKTKQFYSLYKSIFHCFQSFVHTLQLEIQCYEIVCPLGHALLEESFKKKNALIVLSEIVNTNILNDIYNVKTKIANTLFHHRMTRPSCFFFRFSI